MNVLEFLTGMNEYPIFDQLVHEKVFEVREGGKNSLKEFLTKELEPYRVGYRVDLKRIPKNPLIEDHPWNKDSIINYPTSNGFYEVDWVLKVYDMRK